MKLAIPPVVQVLLALLAMWGLHLIEPMPAFHLPGKSWLALAVFIAGMLIIGIAVGLFFRAGTTVDPRHPEKGETLVKDGLYSHTRNPMYLGMAFVLLAAAIFTGQILNLLILVIFVGFMNRFQIAPEEAFLRSRYGEEYEAYTKQVRRWL